MPLPSLTVVDSFKRAPENPLDDGGNWAAIAGAAGAGKIEGEKYVGEPSQGDAAYWTLESFTEHVVAASFYGAEAGLSGSGYIHNCLQGDPATESNYGGYLIDLNPSGGAGNLIVDLYIGAPAFTKLGRQILSGVKDGDSFALGVRAGKVSVWYKPGAEPWELLYQVADATFTAGYAGLHLVESSNGAFTNFSLSGEVTAELTGSIKASSTFEATLRIPSGSGTNVTAMLL